MRLVASYHGVCEEAEVDRRWPEAHEWYERATLSIENGGMAIRDMEAFACSLVASLKRVATIFPEWATLGQQGALLQMSHEASHKMSAQTLHYVEEHRRRVPEELFKESDDFSAISKTIVELESEDNVNSSEAQLQSSQETLKRLSIHLISFGQRE